MNKKIVKLLLLNVGIALVDIFFLKDFFGFKSTDASPLEMAFTVTVIVMSVLVFCTGNYIILVDKKAKAEKQYGYLLEEIDTIPECIDALATCRKTAFHQDVIRAKEQAERLGRKLKALREVLFQKCQAEQGDLLGFEDVIDDSEKLIIENIKRILTRISIFDQTEYDQLQKSGMGGQTYEAKRQMFAEHFAYVKQQIEKNEAILLDLDRLLTEISKIGDQEAVDAETMENIRGVVENLKVLHETKEDDMAALERKYQMKGE